MNKGNVVAPIGRSLVSTTTDPYTHTPTMSFPSSSSNSCSSKGTSSSLKKRTNNVAPTSEQTPISCTLRDKSKFRKAQLNKNLQLKKKFLPAKHASLNSSQRAGVKTFDTISTNSEVLLVLNSDSSDRLISLMDSTSNNDDEIANKFIFKWHEEISTQDSGKSTSQKAVDLDKISEFYASDMLCSNQSDAILSYSSEDIMQPHVVVSQNDGKLSLFNLENSDEYSLQKWIFLLLQLY